jgi:hypothetical protein
VHKKLTVKQGKHGDTKSKMNEIGSEDANLEFIEGNVL